jgi:hypothetical protein
MAYVYAVEFVLFDPAGTQDAVRKHILADDRYEAVQLARQLLALQDPCVDIERIDVCKVVRKAV